MTNNIPQKNLVKMLSNEDGGMLFLLLGESMGGNAGREEGYLCSAANFYYNKITGEIYTFTNDVLENNELHSGLFRVLVNTNLKDPVTPLFFKIVNFMPRQKSSKRVMQIIEESLQLYNLYMRAVIERNKMQNAAGIRGFFKKISSFFA